MSVRRYISCALASVLLVSAAVVKGKQLGSNRNAISCPLTRAHIEPELRTRPADGVYYARTRNAIRKNIDDMIRFMGSPENLRAFAYINRTRALERLSGGVTGAERRYHEDAILRADTLIAILECLQGHT